MTWKNLEAQVRTIASFRWNCNATSETIAGVKCDCILRIDTDNLVAVEITEENNLAKVRNDISKLQTIRNSCFNENVFCKCYFVMKDRPTDSMRSAGEAQKIKVLSVEEFQNEYFDYKSYAHTRSQKQFGSLINAETGKPENNTYITVSYLNKSTGKEFSINDIIAALKRGKRIILKGDFGLGKSRCIKQLFDSLSSNIMDSPYAIAINLRDHWGARRGVEILTRHLQELGLDASNFIKSYEQTNAIYLLDGFDEIGTQSWSSDPRKMQNIRELSVCALKDLISHVQGGVLIAGREYYFNSDEEMLHSMGLSQDSTLILECHHEFTETELFAFICENLTESPDKKQLDKLPIWFPKRPLIIQLLLRYASDIFSVDYALDDICGFWYAFLTKMCEREAKIYPALNPEIIKNVLIYLANKTRSSASNTGAISQSDLSDAFVAAAGFAPNDESSIMLQRLPSLGRIDADSPNRQFVDLFILNALRSEGIIQSVKNWNESFLSKEWKNPLDISGCYILSEYIGRSEKYQSQFLAMARRAATSNNNVLASDIISALCLLDIDSMNFQGIYITNGHFANLAFEDKEICQLNISDSIIEKIDITNAKLDCTLSIKNCIIGTILGIGSKGSIPAQFEKCTVENFETTSTTALIKKARLSEPQKLFVEMVRKIFFQPGAGRMEAALLRGMGTSANRPLSQKILTILIDENLVTRHKGDEGYIYKPVRTQTKRMEKIIADLTLGEDPLWAKISHLS